MESPRCDVCSEQGCKAGQPGKFQLCPTNVSGIEKEEIIEKYNDPEISRVMHAAARTERGTLQMVDGVLTPVRTEDIGDNGVRHRDGV